MKVLYAVSLFSGLETSLLTRHWKPTGVPTVYKLIETLDRGPDEITLFFTCKDRGAKWRESKDTCMNINGLNTPVTVLAGIESFSPWFGRLRGYLREIRQIWRIYRAYKETDPDLIYFDRANLWAAGIFARCFKTPVLFRIMGVKHDMLEALDGKRLIHFLMRWAYRAPYAAVVCTQDGSGIEKWAEKALHPKVHREILINGVDLESVPETKDDRLESIPKNRTVVLFIGSLEEVKGCDEFLAAFLLALKKERNGLHALIVGTGSRSKNMRGMVSDHNAYDHVTFIERMPHDQIILAHQKSDIYVSLNRLGNLSNANLESMKAGTCMIIPEPQKELGIDLVTREIISEEAVLRIPHPRDVKALTEAILYLSRNPIEREKRERAMAKVSENIVTNWGKRIEAEIGLMRSITRCEGV